MKKDLRRLFGITAITIVFILPHEGGAASRNQPYCKQHHVPCTLKHRCVAYLGSNATLNYNNGEYYNYVYKGKFYNYISHGKYYAYFDRGTFYNYEKNGEYYATCTSQPGYWQQGEWVVPNPVCK